MNVEQIREYCLSKKGVTEDYPFDEVTLVLKVMGKMFALVSIDEIPLRINLKCDPELAIELREKYESVLPGYHMNKQHWNTIIVDGSIHPNEIKSWIDDSYNLIVLGLKKSDRDILLKG
ncbi:MAG: MmcQ/YjbR family DNA-binding protein [Ignavibacterium sp.]|nr:MAG: MmcQ/YjbR family DNA-binding protein [Ignavibacterium sp.]